MHSGIKCIEVVNFETKVAIFPLKSLHGAWSNIFRKVRESGIVLEHGIILDLRLY